MEKATDYLRKCNFENPQSNPKAHKDEEFAMMVLVTIGEVASCLDQVHFSIALMSGYRSSSAVCQMNRHDHIQYAIENFYLRITSIYDRCLRLTNLVYGLGLPDRACTNNTILRNDYVKQTPVAKTLKKIDKFTMQFREYRNSVAHRKAFSDEEFDFLGSVYFLFECDESSLRYKNSIKTQTDDYIKKKKIEFQENIVEMEEYVGDYLTELEKIYRRRVH